MRARKDLSLIDMFPNPIRNPNQNPYPIPDGNPCPYWSIATHVTRDPRNLRIFG